MFQFSGLYGIPRGSGYLIHKESSLNDHVCAGGVLPSLAIVPGDLWVPVIQKICWVLPPPIRSL